MKEKINCKIVQDLLPNYIEKLTNEETNIFIEEHLKECKECRNILENMKIELKVDVQNRENREVKYIKKYNSKIRLLEMIILIALLLFVTLTVRKITIISGLSDKAEKTRIATNYHEIAYSYNLGEYSKTETFKLGDKQKKIITQITDDGGISTITMFANKISEEDAKSFPNVVSYPETGIYLVNIYANSSEGKKAKLNIKMEMVENLSNPFHTENLWQLFKYSMLSSIKTTRFNGNECYYISNFKNPYSYGFGGMYVNKDTGFPISTMAYEYEDSNELQEDFPKREPVCEYILELDTVTESDFIEPDISGYELE